MSWLRGRTVERKLARSSHALVMADEPLNGETRWAIESNHKLELEAIRAARELRQELLDARIAIVHKDARGRVQWTEIETAEANRRATASARAQAQVAGTWARYMRPAR